MNRYFVLVLALALALPLAANACQDKVKYLNGVKINATQSATRLCGCDFVISVSDGDQHLVKIDYSYNGMFKTSAGAPETPMNLVQGTRSDKINISVGRNTLAGNLARVAAPEFPIDTLVCRDWLFSFTANEYNASQDARSHEDKLKQKEQARINEINRKKAEEAERKRSALQNQIDYKKAQDQASRDQLAAYKNSSPENSRCIINEPADIARCEQAKARERADRLKLEANEMQKLKQLEAKQIAAAKQEAQFKDAEALYQLTRSDPCGAAAVNARRMPQAQLQVQQNKAAAMQQEQALAQWKQAQSGHDAACAASKNQQQVGTTNPAPGPSEQLEQLRKKIELHKQLLEFDAKDAFLNLRVNDPWLKELLGRYCADPLDQLCKNAVNEAQKLAYMVNAFNDNPQFVALHGRFTAESPGIAAQYAKVQDEASEKSRRDSETFKRNIATVEEQQRERVRAAAQADQERLARDARAAEREQQQAARAQQERAQAEANARAYARQQAEKSAQDARELREGLGQLLDAYGQYQKAKQDAKRPAPSPGGSGGGCGGIGSTTCR